MRVLMKAAALLTLVLGLNAVNSSAKAQDSDFREWQRAVATKIATNQHYPRSAVSRRIEGRAQVRLVIEKDGKIRGYEVVSETGEAVLDREIPRVVTKINPLPALPGDREELVLTIPLIWSLK